MYDVTIRRVRNGVIVHVGCQTFVETDLSVALDEIKEYLLYPTEAQKWWDENYPPIGGVPPSSARHASGMGAGSSTSGGKTRT